MKNNLKLINRILIIGKSNLKPHCFLRKYHGPTYKILTKFQRNNILNDLPPHRNLFEWLNVVWNNYDKGRVKEVGSDQAAAEWLLRCGAQVRFKDQSQWDADYNTLSNNSVKQKYIEAIDTNESCVDATGFQYLKGLEHLKSISLRFSPYVTDNCLKKIAEYCNNTLEDITIEDCYELSEWGLLNHLPLLKHLKHISIKNLPLIDNPSVVKDKLSQLLSTNCVIDIK